MAYDLTGKLKVGDKVIQVFRQYASEQLKQGYVTKLTKTRCTVTFTRSGEQYDREYTLKTGQLYPRSGDYSYTHIEPMDEANQNRFDDHVGRKQLEYQIVKYREYIDGRHHDLSKLAFDKLRTLAIDFSAVVKTLKEIKE